MIQPPGSRGEARSQLSWRNRKRLATASLAVYIGAGIAYKRDIARGGNPTRGEKNGSEESD